MFQKYGLEFDRLLTAHTAAHAYVYSKLKESGADWTDDIKRHFTVNSFIASDRSLNASDLHKDLKAWSQSYNQFDSWNRLNAIIALTSNLETYLASVISLALDSDPGLLLGIPQRVDGVAILKHGAVKVSYEDKITSCVKGDWQSRANSFKAIFGTTPPSIMDHLGELEAIRNLRNKVGHAFGRDIESARRHGIKEILPMESLKLENPLKRRKLLWVIAKSVDIQLLQAHIGEFQAIRFYHELYPRLRKDVNQGQRSVSFKKEIGRFKAVPPGKLFCNGLVKYYEAL